VWRDSAKERRDPILGTAGYLRDPASTGTRTLSGRIRELGGQISGARRLKNSSAPGLRCALPCGRYRGSSYALRPRRRRGRQFLAARTIQQLRRRCPVARMVAASVFLQLRRVDRRRPLIAARSSGVLRTELTVLWAVHCPDLHAECHYLGRAPEHLARIRTGLQYHIGQGCCRSIVHVEVGFAGRRQRSLPDGAAFLELRCPQYHGVCYGCYPGRQLRPRSAFQYWHRPRRHRRRHRLHLPQYEIWDRVVSDAGLYQELREPVDQLYQRDRRASRSGRRAIPERAFFIGIVGYYYQQLTADSGQLPVLGPNESRTRGVGPQIGYNFTVGNTPIYTNLRGYTEFGSYRRLQGHSIFATISIPLSALFQGHSQSP
jgi:hypothetical protein